VKVDNYDSIDGIYANRTDAKALSIGLAQYAEDYLDISAKVWRSKDGNWSRQSEELPLHRVLDLNILMIGSFMKNSDNSFPTTALGESISENGDIGTIHDFYEGNKDELLPRIKELKRLIDKLLNEK